MSDAKQQSTRPATYTVTDRRPARDGEAFHVRGFDARGNLLLHTWHRDEHSMLMEVSAWKNRGALPRGEDADKAAFKVGKWS